jgi:hypothetical protein
VFADNWGGLFDGGDDLDVTVSNITSAESVGLHDVPIQEGGISQHKRTDPISERANEFEGGLTTLRRAPPFPPRPQRSG